VEATAYDLFNFASEVGTHHFGTLAARNRVNGWIGEALTQEYDLEGTVRTFDRRVYEPDENALKAMLPPSEEDGTTSLMEHFA
jgi:hypothetical protein